MDFELAQKARDALLLGDFETYLDGIETLGSVPEPVLALRQIMRYPEPAPLLRRVVAMLRDAQLDEPEVAIAVARVWPDLPAHRRADPEWMAWILAAPEFKRTILHWRQDLLDPDHVFSRAVAERYSTFRTSQQPRVVLSAALLQPELFLDDIEPVLQALLSTDLPDMINFIVVAQKPLAVQLLHSLMARICADPSLLDAAPEKGLHLVLALWQFGMTLPVAVEDRILARCDMAAPFRAHAAGNPELRPVIAARHAGRKQPLCAPAIRPGRARVFLAVTGQLRGFEQSAPRCLERFGEYADEILVDTWATIGRREPVSVGTVERTFQGPLAEAMKLAFHTAGMERGFSGLLPNLARYLHESGQADSHQLAQLYQSQHIHIEDDRTPEIQAMHNQEKLYRRLQNAHDRLRRIFDPDPGDIVIRVRPDVYFRDLSDTGLTVPQAIEQARQGLVIFNGSTRHPVPRAGSYWPNGIAVDDNFALGSWAAMTPYMTLLDWVRTTPEGAAISPEIKANISLGWRLFTLGVKVSCSHLGGAFISSYLTDYRAICSALEADLTLYGPGSRDHQTVANLLAAAQRSLAD